MKFYKYEEWDIVFPKDGLGDYCTNLYVDLDGSPITGILENFKYHKEGDPRNNKEVINGKYGGIK